MNGLARGRHATVARASRVALAALTAFGCGHATPAPQVEPAPVAEVPQTAPRDPVLRVHHHWAECREGSYSDLTVTIDGVPCDLAPGEHLAVPLTPGPHAVALGPDRNPAPGEPGPMQVPMHEDRDLHVGCRPHVLHRGYLVPLVLRPDGATGFTGRVVAGGVEVELVAGRRAVILLPRGSHRLEPRGLPGCPATATQVTLAGAGAIAHLGPCGEARVEPPPPLVPVAPGRCAFGPASVGSAP
jgi:hypothetical protein